MTETELAKLLTPLYERYDDLAISMHLDQWWLVSLHASRSGQDLKVVQPSDGPWDLQAALEKAVERALAQ